jgi:hypothetical protein
MPLASRTQVAVLTLSFAAACAGPEAHFESSPRVVEIVHSAGAKLGGVALGDVLPERVGLEIVAVAVDGRVIVVRRNKDHWRSDVACQTPGELIAVACGDLVPSHPGDEIVAVGMASGDEDSGGAGAVWLVTRNRGAGYEARRLLEPSALQHAVAIGDFDPLRPGLEALSAGFDERVHLFAIDADLVATHREVATLPGPAKGACVRGTTALLACASGHVVEVAGQPDGSFTTRVVLARESGFARPAVFGDLLVVAADDGALVAQDLSSSAPFEVLHQQGAKARGAFIGDLDTASVGLEAATVGYEGDVWLLRLGAPDAQGRPEAVRLVATGAALHHLAGGDVLPDRPGDELVTVGYSGDVRILMR